MLGRRPLLVLLVLAATAAAEPCPPLVGEVQCYEVKPSRFPVVPTTVEDRLGVLTYPVRFPHRLCAPLAGQTQTPFLMGYTVEEDAPGSPRHRVVNRFGTTTVDLVRPLLLLVPTAASTTAPPAPHAVPPGPSYQCWQVRPSAGAPAFEPIRDVRIADDLETVTVDLIEPSRLCLPATIDGEPPGAPSDPRDLLCYTSQSAASFGDVDLFTQNRFGTDEARLIHRREVCVPSQTDGAPPLPACPTTTTLASTTTSSTSLPSSSSTTSTTVASTTTTTAAVVTTTTTSTTAPSVSTTTTTLPRCGDGVVDGAAGEECDDANTVPGDCCSATCRLEPDGSPCDDGDVCNGDDRCRAGACEGVTAAQSQACRNGFAVAAVSNFRGDSVSLLDGPSGRIAATVPVGDGPWGIALHPAGREIWITNRGDHTVSVVDLPSGSVVATIRVSRVPLGIVIDASGARAYVASYGADRVEVIETATRRRTARFRVDRGPSGLVFDESGRTLWVTHYAGDTVVALDPATGRVLARIRTGRKPTQLGLDAPRGRLYVTNFGGRSITVVGLVSRTALATIDVGRKPFGIAVDPVRARAYVTNAGEDVVTVIDTIDDVVLERRPVPPGPLGIGVDPAGRILVTSGSAGVLTFLDPAGGASTAVAVGALPVAYGQFIGTVANDCPLSAPACGSLDPTLIARCGPQLGCEIAPRAGLDALHALLDAMAEALRVAAPETFRDAALAGELAASVERARGALVAGAESAIRGELRNLVRSVSRGLARGAVANDTGLRLLDLARRARVLTRRSPR